MTTRKELVEALRLRYRSAAFRDRIKILDEPGQLDATPAQLDAHRRLVEQAERLFGVRPWRHYDMMLALSTEFGQWGVEHQESSENGARPGYFLEWDKAIRSRWIIPP